MCKLFVFVKNTSSHATVRKQMIIIELEQLLETGFNPMSRHTKDFKNGTWYLLA